MKSSTPLNPMTPLILDESGEYVTFSIDKMRSDRSSHSVSADPRQYDNAPSNFTIATTTGTVMTLAEGEKGFIQNLGTGTLAVKKGENASSSSLSFILKASNAPDDGTGGSVNLNDWVGPVSIASGNGGQVRYIAWKVSE